MKAAITTFLSNFRNIIILALIIFVICLLVFRKGTTIAENPNDKIKEKQDAQILKAAKERDDSIASFEKQKIIYLQKISKLDSSLQVAQKQLNKLNQERNEKATAVSHLNDNDLVKFFTNYLSTARP
jgi:hypothetical protein